MGHLSQAVNARCWNMQRAEYVMQALALLFGVAYGT
jgi:hypothetical protein